MTCNFAIIISLICIYFITFIKCECPNACSGNGDCMAHDQCNCFVGYMDNDCSQYVCPSGNAHVDTPRGDLNMDGTLTSLYTTVTPVYPNGIYEAYNPNASPDEAHFYMECSNNGICDRTHGICVCFPGYEGSSCQRQICANSCSGHGSCESISKFANKADGTLVGRTRANGTTTYTLWDSNLIYGCRCDPYYTAPDCSQRLCKIGADPLYAVPAIEMFETILIQIGMSGGSDSPDSSLSYFRLRLFDYNGESYLTDRISVGTSSSTTAAAIVSAVTGFPNAPFGTQFSCQNSPTTSTSYYTAAMRAHTTLTTSFNGVIIACQFANNIGTIRLPLIEDYTLLKTGSVPPSNTPVIKVFGTTLRGEMEDLTPTYIGEINILGNTATFSVVVGTLPSSGYPYLGRINTQYVVLSSATTIVFPYSEDDAPTGVLFYNTTSTAITAKEVVSSWSPGSYVATLSTAPTTKRGDWILYFNQIFIIRSVDTIGNTITVDRPFYGNNTDGSAISSGTLTYYKIGADASPKGYPYVGECSFKGLCDRTSGTCMCTKGYSGDNCGTQNALAI